MCKCKIAATFVAVIYSINKAGMHQQRLS